MVDSDFGWSASFFLLALLISFLSSYTMFSFVSNLKQTSGAFRPYWLAGGAFVFGVGIWLKHFVVILATDRLLYFSWDMLAGLFFNIFFSVTCFLVLNFQGVFRHPLLAGSVIMAFGISFTTYFNLLSQPIEKLSAHPLLIILSLAVLCAGAVGSFMVSEKCADHHRWLAALMLGISLMAEQLIAMKAIRSEYGDGIIHPNWEVYLLSLIVGIAALLLIMSALLTWYIDKRLSQMDERYRLLVEKSMDMIAMIEGDKWKYVNTAGLRLLEADKPDDLLGKPVWQLVPPEYQEQIKSELLNKNSWKKESPFELKMYTLKGKLLHTEIVASKTKLGNRSVLQLIIRDISERKKNEELLINSEKLLVAGQLAAGIAHEIRNPLTSLKGFLNLIRSGETSTRYFDIMSSELDRIDSIVSELLMLTKPRVYELSHHDLRDVMQDTITLLETQANMHNIEINVVYDEGPHWVYCVENQIKQVFINVLKNAIEAMIIGGMIEVRLKRHLGQVYIQIKDEGPGIREEDLAKIGQPFYTTKENGTGLGLMVSYKIVDNHQGRMNVRSEVGKGTTFEIILPYRPPEGASTSK
jgi:PAS domain S-box-containing protein